MKPKLYLRTLTVLIAVLLLCSCLAVPAFAEDQMLRGQRWNIMLVIDGSGSLFSAACTDPEGLRYEAVNSFLDVIPLEGNSIGAIVFSANESDNTSDSAMKTGISLDTGLLDMPVGSDESLARKEFIKEAISDKRTLNHNNGATTDIGTALLVSAEELEEKSRENGLPSAIFLFTDGQTELNYPATIKKSSENLNSAIDIIKDNGIEVCGVFLNKDGKSKSSEVHDIVCRANDLPLDTFFLSNKYIELNTSKDITTARDMFLSMLNWGKFNDNNDVDLITDSADRSFVIPGIGVEEANILLETSDGKALPEGMNVTITRPDGTAISDSEERAICSVSRTYCNYKIKAPASGKWNVHVELPAGNKVGIYYKPKFSTYLQATAKSVPDASDVHSNMDVQIQGLIVLNGNEITDPSAYNEYSCTLDIYNSGTGKTESFAIEPDDHNQFISTYHLNGYDRIDAYITFYCDMVSARSEKLSFNLANNPPEANDFKAKIKYGLFHSGKGSFDLRDYCSDAEDGSDLQYSISRCDCDASGVDLNGSVLDIDCARSGSGTVHLTATDSNGDSAECQCKIIAKNMTPVFIAIFIGAALLAFIASIVIARLTRAPQMDGITSFAICAPSSVTGFADDRDMWFTLTTPGTFGVKRSISLYELIKLDISRADHGSSNIQRECRVSGCSFDDMVNYFNKPEIKKQLGCVRLSCRRIDNPDEKSREIFRKVGELVVSVNGDKRELYNSSERFNYGDNYTLRIKYSVPRQ